MEVIAQSKHIRISPRKMRLVADLIRGLPAQEALAILSHLNKKASQPLLLVLKQGMGNAVNNFKLNKDSLFIKRLEIGKGPTFKRGRAVSRGVWHSIMKRTSHINLVLEGEEIKKGVKSGTKS